MVSTPGVLISPVMVSSLYPMTLPERPGVVNDVGVELVVMGC